MSRKEKKALISRMIGNNPRTVDNHIREERPYTKFFEYFSSGELEEFLSTGIVKKLELIKEVSLPRLQEYLAMDINTSASNILKNALFKIDTGMDKSLVFPIFEEAIMDIEECSESTIIKKMENKINSKKLNFFRHENHRKLAIQFMHKYLSAKELCILQKHFTS